MYKKYNILILLIAVGLLLTVGLLNYVIDPLFHYHTPYFGMEPVINDERYQNPGIAEHFTYDSTLIGSSMTQNFSVSQLNEAFNADTVKLTYSAIRTTNIKYMLEKSFATHEIKNVFLGADPYTLLSEPGDIHFPLPEYLYDDNLWNDTNYLLNKSILLNSSLYQVKYNIKDNVPDIDIAYRWDDGVEFSKEKAMSSVEWDIHKRGEVVDRSDYISNMHVNIESDILPYIEDHPETTFYIFYPPYSLLWWNKCMYKGDLESVLQLVSEASTTFTKYDNVKLYGFQTIMPLVSDLNNYKDLNHYSGKVNEEMVEWMKNDTYRLMPEEIPQYIDDLRVLVTTFDYTKFKEK